MEIERGEIFEQFLQRAVGDWYGELRWDGRHLDGSWVSGSTGSGIGWSRTVTSSRQLAACTTWNDEETGMCGSAFTCEEASEARRQHPCHPGVGLRHFNFAVLDIAYINRAARSKSNTPTAALRHERSWPTQPCAIIVRRPLVLPAVPTLHQLLPPLRRLTAAALRAAVM